MKVRRKSPRKSPRKKSRKSPRKSLKGGKHVNVDTKTKMKFKKMFFKL